MKHIGTSNRKQTLSVASIFMILALILSLPLHGVSKNETTAQLLNGINFSINTKLLKGCVTENFTFAINNQSSVEKENILVAFSSPGNIFKIDLNNYTTTSTNPTLSVSGNYFSIANLAMGEEVIISIPVTALCNSLTGETEQHNIEYIPSVGSTTGTKQIQTIQVSSGYLVYNSELSTNLNQIPVHLNTTFTRSYIFTNNSVNNSFSGTLSFEDTKATAIDITNIHIKALMGTTDITSSVISSTGSGINASTGNVDLKIQINELPPNATIEIVEDVLVKQCPQNTGTTSNIMMKWGCNENICLDFDEESGSTLVKTATIRRGDERADLKWKVIEDSEVNECIDGTSNVRKYKLRLINEGSDIAYNYETLFRASHAEKDRSITRINSSSFKVTDLEGISNVSVNSMSFDTLRKLFRSTDCIQPGQNVIVSVNIKIPEMRPQQFIDFEWEEIDCCPLTMGGMNGFMLGSYTLHEYQRYFDECGIERNPVTTMSHKSGNGSMWLNGMKQEIIPTVSNMFGCEVGRPTSCGDAFTECSDTILNSENNKGCDFTESFAIENNLFAITPYWPLDQATFSFEVDLILESRLVLAPRNHFISGSKNTGNVRLMVNGVPYLASAVNSISPPSDIDYISPTAFRAKFEFPQSLFHRNGKFEMRYLQDFINASELHFDMSAVCEGPEPKNSKPRYLERFYFIPSNNCPTNTCRLMIGEEDGDVNVMCPGCDWPGVITNSFEFKRTTIGANDGNNNGLPDDIIANEGIRYNSATYKDKIRSKSVSVFWDNGMYGTITEPGALQQDPNFGLNFLNNFCRLDEIPEGQYLDVIPSSIEINIIRNGITILNTALHPTITRPDNIVTRKNGEFLYQVHRDFVRQFPGLSDFEYQSGDHIEIISDYVVERDFDFGSTIYTKNIEVPVKGFITNGYKSLDCNDGSACDPKTHMMLDYDDTFPFDTIRKDFIFYCEGWSTPFTWIDGLQELKHDYLADHYIDDATKKCIKSLQFRANFHPGNRPNVFPFEVRNVGRAKYMDVHIPNGYSIDFAHQRTYLQSSVKLRNNIQYDYIDYSQIQRLQSDYNIKEIENTANPNGRTFRFTFNYGSYLPDNFPPDYSKVDYLSNGVHFNSNDEWIMGVVNLIIAPDCSQDKKPTQVSAFSQRTDLFTNSSYAGVFPVGSNIVPYPTVRFGELPDNSTIDKQEIDANTNYHKLTVPSGNLELDPYQASYDISTRDYCFDISIRNENNIIAENPFVLPEITKPGFQIISIKRFNGGDVTNDNNWVLVNPTNGVYSLPNLAVNGGTSLLRICGTYNCQETNASTEEFSTVKFHYGWNCTQGMPQSISDIANVCNIQNSTYTFYPKKANLTSALSFAAEPSCDELSYSYTMTSIDLGGIYDLKSIINLPSTVKYKPNSAKFTLVNKNNVSSSSISLEPEQGTLTWDLNKLKNGTLDLIDPIKGLFDQQKVIMTFSVNPTCLFNNEPVSVSASAKSFCNATITPEVKSAVSTLVCTPIELTILTDEINCVNQNVELTGSIQGGAEPFVYRWFINDHIQDGSTDISFSGPYVANGTYTLEVTDSKGCTISKSIILKSNLIVSAGQDQEICQYEKVNLTGVILEGEATEYSWTPSATLTNSEIINPVASPITTTTYIFTAKDVNGCSASDEVVVTVNPAPDSRISTADGQGSILIPGCHETVTLMVKDGYAYYQWYKTENNQRTIINGATSHQLTVNTTGYYSVTVETDKGCKSTSGVNVIGGISISGDTEICPGENAHLTVSLSGVVGQYNVQWFKNGAQTSENSKEGLYYAIVVLPQITPACTLRTADHPVNLKPVPAAFTVSAEGETNICPNDSPVKLIASSPASSIPAIATWSWSTGETEAIIYTNKSGSYSVTAIGENGCRSTSNSVVIVTPTASITQHCQPDGTTLLSSDLNITGNNFQWFDGQGNLIGYTKSIVVATDGTYTLKVTDVRCDVIATTQVCRSQDVIGINENILEGGDFNISNNTSTDVCSALGFNSDLSCTNTPLTLSNWPGNYKISSSASSEIAGYPGLWQGVSYNDPADPTDRYFMLADGKVTPSKERVWYKTVQVEKCATYTFSALVDNIIVSEAEIPGVSLKVGNTTITRQTIFANQSNWVQLSGTWKSDITGEIEIAILLDGGGWVGRDIGIDEIYFGKSSCTPITSRPCNARAEAGINKYICAGTSIQIGKNSYGEGLSFKWIAPGFESQLTNPLVSPTVTTTYTVTVTDEINQCSSTDKVTVFILTPSVSITANKANDCSIEFIASGFNGMGNPVYQWYVNETLKESNLSGQFRPVNAKPGDKVKCVLRTLCNVQASSNEITIEDGDIFSADLGHDVIACESSLTLTAKPSGAAAYSWSTGATSESIEISQSGTYSVNITNATGCTSTDEIQITLHPAFVVSAGNDVSLCASGSTLLNATVTGGTAPYNFSWTPEETINERNIHNPIANPNITTSYNVLASDANGCSSSDEVLIYVLTSNPTVQKSRDCATGNVVLTVNLQGIPESALNIQWQRKVTTWPYGYKNVTGANSKEFVPTQNGTYKVIVYASTGCSKESSTVNVTLSTPISVSLSASQSTICSGDATTLQAYIQGGTGPYIVTWKNGNMIINQGYTQSINVSPENTTTYYVHVRDDNGCVKTASITITVNERPLISAGDDKGICVNESVMLTGTVEGGATPYTITWSPVTGLDNSNILNPTANPSVSTTYTLQVTGSNQCTSTDQVTVGVMTTNPRVSKTVNCITGETTLIADVENVSPNLLSYQWQMRVDYGFYTRYYNLNGNTDRTITFNSNGKFRVITKAINGCSYPSNVMAAYASSPISATISASTTTVCSGSAATLTSNVTGGTATKTYNWRDEFGNQLGNMEQITVMPQVPTRYFLNVRDNNNCTAVSNVTINTCALKQSIVTNNKAELQVELFPNPSSSKASLLVNHSEISKVKIEVINLNGVIVFEQDEVHSNEPIEFGEKLRSGVYQVKVIGHNQVKVLRFVKTE